MKLRILPLEVFATVGVLSVLSLIYAPAPLISGFGGYSHRTMMISVLAGCILAAGSVFCLFQTISFRNYLRLVLASGLVLVVYSLFSLKAEPGPRALFLIYGLILAAGSVTTQLPSEVAASDVPRRKLQEQRTVRAFSDQHQPASSEKQKPQKAA